MSDPLAGAGPPLPQPQPVPVRPQPAGPVDGTPQVPKSEIERRPFPNGPDWLNRFQPVTPSPFKPAETETGNPGGSVLEDLNFIAAALGAVLKFGAKAVLGDTLPGKVVGFAGDTVFWGGLGLGLGQETLRPGNVGPGGHVVGTSEGPLPTPRFTFDPSKLQLTDAELAKLRAFYYRLPSFDTPTLQRVRAALRAEQQRTGSLPDFKLALRVLTGAELERRDQVYRMLEGAATSIAEGFTVSQGKLRNLRRINGTTNPVTGLPELNSWVGDP